MKKFLAICILTLTLHQIQSFKNAASTEEPTSVTNSSTITQSTEKSTTPVHSSTTSSTSTAIPSTSTSTESPSTQSSSTHRPSKTTRKRKPKPRKKISNLVWIFGAIVSGSLVFIIIWFIFRRIDNSGYRALIN